MEDHSSPFDLFNDIAFRLKHLFEAIERKDKEVPKRVTRLCKDIQALCAFDIDAALGAVHVAHGHPYIICHPLHIAIICEIINIGLNYYLIKMYGSIGAALATVFVIIVSSVLSNIYLLNYLNKSE